MNHLKPVTLWAVWNSKTKKYVHNHLEDGHVSGDKPEPKFPAQQGWLSSKWRKEHKYLNHECRIVDEMDV